MGYLVGVPKQEVLEMPMHEVKQKREYRMQICCSRKAHCKYSVYTLGQNPDYTRG